MCVIRLKIIFVNKYILFSLCMSDAWSLSQIVGVSEQSAEVVFGPMREDGGNYTILIPKWVLGKVGVYRIQLAEVWASYRSFASLLQLSNVSWITAIFSDVAQLEAFLCPADISWLRIGLANYFLLWGRMGLFLNENWVSREEFGDSESVEPTEHTL